MSSVAWWIIALGATAFGAIAFCLLRCRARGGARIPDGVPAIERQSIDLPDVVEYFKQPALEGSLKTSPDLAAVAIKQPDKTGGFLVSLCLFDRNTESVSQKHFTAFKVKEIGHSLASAFADKDMLVLQ